MRYFMAALAIVACPCHLPLLVALLGGTALGAVLSENMSVAFVALTVLFVLAVWAALRMFGGPRSEGTTMVAGCRRHDGRGTST